MGQFYQKQSMGSNEKSGVMPGVGFQIPGRTRGCRENRLSARIFSALYATCVPAWGAFLRRIFNFYPADIDKIIVAKKRSGSDEPVDETGPVCACAEIDPFPFF